MKYIWVFLGILDCSPAIEKRVENTNKADDYRKELDACYDKFIDKKDKVGYYQCHCDVNQRWNRPCP